MDTDLYQANNVYLAMSGNGLEYTDCGVFRDITETLLLSLPFKMEQ